MKEVEGPGSEQSAKVTLKSITAALSRLLSPKYSCVAAAILINEKLQLRSEEEGSDP